MKEILRDKENFDILEGFLSELLKRKIVIENILESEGNPETSHGKINRVDLKAQMDTGEKVIFEIQFGDKVDFLGKMLFNSSKAIVEQLSKGDLYNIKKIYSINIAYFDLGPKKEYLFQARLTEFTGVHNFNESIPFSQNLDPVLLKTATEIHPEYYIILPQNFDEKIREKFDEWVYVLKNSTVKSEFSAAGVQEAGEKLDIAKMSDEERVAYEKNRANYMDYKSEIYTAEVKGKLAGITEGKIEGKIEGELQKAIEIAKEMKQDGMSIAQIVKYSGLTEAEIKAL